MEQQKKMIENEHLTSLEKLKEREEEIRQLHKVQCNNCGFKFFQPKCSFSTISEFYDQS